MSNDINEVRQHLFDALRGLSDKDKPLDIDRARAVAEVSREIINSAKVEVDFLKVTGATAGTDFIPPAIPKPGEPRLVKGRAQSGSA